jgi:hypothetical protein
MRWIVEPKTGELVPPEEYYARKQIDVARSRLPCPMLISDQTEPVRSMVDGKTYDSKSALRRTYSPSGNAEGERYNEVGNETQEIPSRPKPDRKAIRESVRRAASRVGISV